MPFRATFDCLWCGARHTTRSPDDVEGWAQLCPACVGRAGENGFLRRRLRTALDERGDARVASAGDLVTTTSAPAAAATGTAYRWRAPSDEWYLRRGPFATDALEVAAWTADLDAATLRIDGMPIGGRIVELDAGTGWWSPLLAGKGELWAHVASDPDLVATTRRLLAHDLRAHVHVGPPGLASASADVVFWAFGLGGLGPDELERRLRALRAALRPGGSLVSIDLVANRRAPVSPSSTRPAGVGAVAGPEPVDPRRLEVALAATGFASVEVELVGRSLVVARSSVASVPMSEGFAAT